MEENKINSEKNDQEQDIKEGLKSETNVNGKTQTVQNPSAGSSEVSQNISNKNKKTGKIAIIAAAVLVLICAGSAASSSAYKKPIKNYYEAIEKQDGKKLKKVMGKTIVSAIEDMYDDDDDVDDLFDDLAESEYDSLVDEYGKKLKIKYKIVDKEKLDKSDRKKIEKQFKETYKEKVKVSKGYELDVEVTYKGKDDKETKDETVKVIKLNGEWVADIY